MSSAMSAAKAAADHMKDVWQGTPEGEFVSMGVVSDGSYGIAKDIVFSFPVTIKNKTWKIVEVSDFKTTAFWDDMRVYNVFELSGLTSGRLRA